VRLYIERTPLFYRTLNGAQVGDLFMSLIHTCQLRGADSFDYLIELQRHAQELAAYPAQWMPWSYRETLAWTVNHPERFPLNRPLTAVSLPTIYATIELQRGNPQKAIDILQPAIPFDLCEFSSLAAVYIRGQAFLRLECGQRGRG
jgi:hypothetical protein